MRNIAIFASGAGSNAREIIKYFRNHPSIRVALVVCNKEGAGVITIANNEEVPLLMIEKERFFRGDAYVPELNHYQIELIVLAGFLWKVPDALIAAFHRQIINIHPALLPAFGGKGMYGMRVHEAVMASGDMISGITIHYVDDEYDHGETIFRAYCEINKEDTPASLAAKVHQLEHMHYPRVIGEVIDGKP